MNITKLTLTEINILQVVLTKIGWFRSQIKFDHNAVRALTKKLDAIEDEYYETHKDFLKEIGFYEFRKEHAKWVDKNYIAKKIQVGENEQIRYFKK